MNLRERKALLAKKSAYVQLNNKLTAKKAEGAKLKLKAGDTTVELTDEEIQALEADAQACIDACADLQTQISELGDEAESTQEEVDSETAEIKSEEESLKAAAAAGISHKTKSLENTGGHSNMSYLTSKAAGQEFMAMIKSHKGESVSDFRGAWVDHITGKGVTVKETSGLEDILPTSYVTQINSAFADGFGVAEYAEHDPRYAASFGFNSTKNLGKGHKRDKEKKDLEFVFTAITLKADEIYAKAKYSYADEKLDTTGAYIDYLMKELSVAILRAVERAMIIGDGLPETDDDHIVGIKPIAGETDEKLISEVEIDLAAKTFDQNTIEQIVAATDQIIAPGTPVLVTTKAIARKIRTAKDAEGRFIDPNWAAPIVEGKAFDLMGMTAFAYDFMNDSAVPAVIFASKSYTLNGDTPNEDNFEWYDVRYNNNHIEFAGVMGGRLTKYKSAVKLNPVKP